MTHPIIILGTGYSGRHLTNALTATSRPFFATSREPDKNLVHVPTGRRMKFDLEQPSTWPNIPAHADLIWCFPATPLEQVQAFARTLDAPPRRIVILGSTSAYEVSDHSAEYPPSWIDESAPIDLSQVACAGRGISARSIMAPSSSVWPESTDQGGTRWIGSGKAASAHRGSM